MVYIFGDCELDDCLYVLRCAGEPLKLEPKVFEVLVYLIHHCDRFVSRNELIEQLWPSQVVGEAALTQCVAKARKAVRDDGGKQQIIKTQHGRGYRFVAEVTVRTDERPSEVIAVSGNKVLPLHPSPQTYWQKGLLALVGFTLVFGVMMTMWHFSLRPSSPAGEGRKEATVPEATLIKDEQKRLWLLSTHSPEASEYCLRGWDDYYRFTSEANAQARQMFARAVALDPQYAVAYASLGWTYWLDWTWFWSQDPQNLEQAFVLAQKALGLNDSLPASHLLLSRVYLLKKQHDRAIAEAERAIALASTCADCYVTLADILTFAGHPQEAFGLVEKATHLDPFSAGYYEATLGRAYYLLGRYEEAITTLNRALIRNPNFLTNHLNLAIAYSGIGREEEARAELAESQKLSPRLSLEGLRQRIPHKDPQTVERLLTALREAGLN